MLSKNTRLIRAPELDIKLLSNDQIKLTYAGRSYTVEFHGLKILDTFSAPHTLNEALNELAGKSQSTQDWMDLTQTILLMVKAGILIDPSQQTDLAIKPNPYGFDAASIHIAMLNDRRRSQSYLDAIRKCIRPGEVVLDIGAGSGLLAVAAAQAGAGRVYAVEASSIGRVAQQIFAANGFEEKISLISGWSTQVFLPEQVDWIISEIIGNDPFGERVLEATIDARKRFLKPGGHLIPETLEVFALPVTVPQEIVNEYLFSKPAIENWQAWYEINFQPLLDRKLEAPLYFGTIADAPGKWQHIAEGTSLLKMDFATVESLIVQGQADCVALIDGLLNGVMIYFDLGLGANFHLEVSPEKSDRTNSWRLLVWLLTEPVSIQKGDRFRIEYRYHGAGAPDGVFIHRL